MGVCHVQFKSTQTWDIYSAFLPRVGFQHLSWVLLPSGNDLQKHPRAEQRSSSFSPILSLLMRGDLGAKMGMSHAYNKANRISALGSVNKSTHTSGMITADHARILTKSPAQGHPCWDRAHSFSTRKGFLALCSMSRFL